MLTTWYWASQPPQQGAALDSPVCSILFQQHKETKPWGTKAPFGRHCSWHRRTWEPQLSGGHRRHPTLPFIKPPAWRNKLKWSLLWKRSRLLKSFQLFFCLSWLIAVVYFYWHSNMLSYCRFRFICFSQPNYYFWDEITQLSLELFLRTYMIWATKRK